MKIYNKIKSKIPAPIKAKIKEKIKRITFKEVFISIMMIVFIFSAIQITRQIVNKTYDEKIFEINEKEDNLNDIFEEEVRLEYEKVMNVLNIQIHAENITKDAIANNQKPTELAKSILEESKNKEANLTINDIAPIEIAMNTEDMEIQNKPINKSSTTLKNKEKILMNKILKARIEQRNDNK